MLLYECTVARSRSDQCSLVVGLGVAYTPVDTHSKMLSFQLGVGEEVHARDVDHAMTVDASGGAETIVSPTIVAGQVDGGAVQGLGQALCEQIVYDRDSAQILTASFQDYAMPRADLCSGFFQTRFDTSIPCLTNVLGVKGVGELGTIGATPAVVNAVIDALDHAGQGRHAERIQMPLTPPRVWRALAGEFDASPFG